MGFKRRKVVKLVARSNVVPLAAPTRAEECAAAKFLELLDRDIAASPESIVPVPEDFFARMKVLREKMDDNIRAEQMEC